MQTFIVYKSSAGSGKTYTLVKEYLKIVLENPLKIKNILAITFTNAAAAEMKERIIAALGDLATLSGKTQSERTGKGLSLLTALKSETRLESSEIIHNAQLALTLILHNYGDFSVSTIDSFAHRIIRSFAFDLRLPLNFDVELDQDQMLGQAIDLLVSRAGSDPALTHLLVEYIESRTDEEKSHFIEYDMARLARNLMDEKGTIYIDRLKGITLEDFGHIHQKLNKSIGDFEHAVQQLALDARSLIDQHGIDNENFARGKSGIGSYFGNLAKGLIIEKISPNSYVQKTVADNKWTAAKADPSACAAIDSISSQLKEYFLKIQALAESKLSLYKIFRLVKKHLFPMAVLCELEKVIDEIKSEQSMLHISDFNKKISEIVSSETAPFIYERIGERYHHYMIDEFQDTSGLQWQNLLPLIDNSLASGHINLVVGDGKQAIYRWRNGDVEQFANLPLLSSSIKAEARELWQQSLNRNYNPLVLDANWRSLPEIIDFNNRFFEFAKTYLPSELAKIYDAHMQKKHPEKTGGYVQIDFVGKIPEENLDYQQHTFVKILEIISKLTKHHHHPLNDITILCRSNNEASAIARFLLEEGLNVISSESLLLSQSSKVNFMLSIMRLISHANDEVSLAEFITYLIQSNTIACDLHEALQQLCQGNTKENNTTEEIEKFLQHHGINFLLSQSRHLGLYELGESIVRSFFEGEKPDPFIAFFMDVLYEYSNRHVSSLSDFLEWWQLNSGKYSVVVPEGIDAVQVMTIHKSKGLQFPVVIYPFVDNDFSRLGKAGEWVELDQMPETSPLSIAWLTISSALEGTPYEEIWTQEKGRTLLDILNIIYVAFTRAIDKLFVVSKYPDSGKFSEKNLAGLLQKFIDHEGLWNENTYTFIFGQNHECITNSIREDYGVEEKNLFEEYVSLPWAQRISVRSKQMEIHDDRTNASERGSRIHDVMEKIHHLEDVPKVLNQLLMAGLIDGEEKESLTSKIASIIGHPAISQWYIKGLAAKNECGMYDSKGSFFRADRVILDQQSATVIDYKTGQPKPEHTHQINRYASIIEEMGYNKVDKYLVYLDLNVVEKV